MHQLEQIQDNAPAFSAWKRALQVRNTYDYRLLSEPQLTLLERLEKLRAEAKALDAATAAEHVENDTDVTHLAAWSRILNEHGPSVQTGHRILDSSLRTEMAEAAEICATVAQTKLTQENYVTLLNAEPQPCITANDRGEAVFHVIPWGNWAGFIQRHLCHAIQHDFDFLQSHWGVPDMASRYRQSVDNAFGALRLYPFVRRQNATELAYYRQAQEDSMKVVRATPHLVPTEAWNEICYYPRFDTPIYIPPPHAFVNEWHRFEPEPGTAYNICCRITHPSLTSRPDYSALLAQLHAMAPYNTDVTDYFLQNTAKRAGRAKVTYQEMEAGYAPVSDYCGYIASAIAEAAKGDDQAYEKWLKKAAAIDPTTYYDLGEFYANHGQETNAALAYKVAIAKDSDHVRISNNVSWLIMYCERTGNSAKATELADFAAEVYSSAGLEAKARLLESRNDLDGALELYNKIDERYDSPGEKLAFLIRIKDLPGKSLQLTALTEKAIDDTFPNGLEKIDLSNLKTPPANGVVLRNESYLTEQYGLKLTDVIVGIRGYHTPSVKTFIAIRDSQPNTPFTLCLWRDNHYIELNAAPPNNRFGVELDEYSKK